MHLLNILQIYFIQHYIAENVNYCNLTDNIFMQYDSIIITLYFDKLVTILMFKCASKITVLRDIIFHAAIEN